MTAYYKTLVFGYAGAAVLAVFFASQQIAAKQWGLVAADLAMATLCAWIANHYRGRR